MIFRFLFFSNESTKFKISDKTIDITAHYKLHSIICSYINQAFSNCVHSFDGACHVLANGITHARIFMHGID